MKRIDWVIILIWIGANLALAIALAEWLKKI